MIAKNGAKVVKKNDMCKNTCHFSYFLYKRTASRCVNLLRENELLSVLDKYSACVAVDLHTLDVINRRVGVNDNRIVDCLVARFVTRFITGFVTGFITRFFTRNILKGDVNNVVFS